MGPLSGGPALEAGMGCQIELMDEGQALENEVDTTRWDSLLLENSLCTCQVRRPFPQERLPELEVFFAPSGECRPQQLLQGCDVPLQRRPSGLGHAIKR